MGRNVEREREREVKGVGFKGHMRLSIVYCHCLVGGILSTTAMDIRT